MVIVTLFDMVNNWTCYTNFYMNFDWNGLQFFLECDYNHLVHEDVAWNTNMED